MARFRALSPQWFADLLAKRVDNRTEELARRVITSRVYWLAPVDYDAPRDWRLAQLVGFGLIDDAELDTAVRALEDMGRLVSIEQTAAEMRTPDQAATEQLLAARARLAGIAQLAEAIAGDASGMGTHTLAVVPELAAQLTAVEDRLRAIADALVAARAAYAREQVERLGLVGRRDLKLHLGAGPTRLDGWVNIDVFPAEVSMNMSWPLPFEDESVAFVYAGHAFEHLYYAGEALALLREVRRVLAPGGVFRIIVPDMGLFLAKYAAGDRAFFDHWRANGLKLFSLFTTPMELINVYNATGRDPSEFFMHKFGYDYETLAKIAERAGYTSVARSSYMASAHPELRVDEISIAARLAYNGEHYSLFVELVK
jgi:predicted SAM-dependent methyltransferase